MVSPPAVVLARRPVHAPLHVAEEGLHRATDARAAPHMLPRLIDLVMEGVVDGDVGGG